MKHKNIKQERFLKEMKIEMIIIKKKPPPESSY
jgi:hypothetical protein